MSCPTSALLLTAGLGTRLHPLTTVRAKAAIPVAGEPLIRRLIKWLAGQSVTRLTLNLHHRPETIAAVLGDGADLGVTVRYSWEQPVLLGSAGGPRQALDIVGTDSFFLVNGDTLTDVDLDTLWRAHEAAGASVTMALIPNQEFLRYGGVRLAPDGAVTGFVPRGPAAEDSFHFVSVQVVRRDVFSRVPLGSVAASIGGVYDALIRERPGSIRGLVMDTAFWDVGTVQDYWHMSARFGAFSAAPRRDLTIDPTARVEQSILWDRVTIGRGAHLHECIVTDDVRVADGASFSRTILLRTPEGRIEAHPFLPERRG